MDSYRPTCRGDANDHLSEYKQLEQDHTHTHLYIGLCICSAVDKQVLMIMLMSMNKLFMYTCMYINVYGYQHINSVVINYK